MTLAELPHHHPALLRAIGGERSFRRRLLELGLVPGTEIRVRNVAPLGDPIEIELRGCRLSIRRAEALRIDVEPAEAG